MYVHFVCIKIFTFRFWSQQFQLGLNWIFMNEAQYNKSRFCTVVTSLLADSNTQKLLPVCCFVFKHFWIKNIMHGIILGSRMIPVGFFYLVALRVFKEGCAKILSVRREHIKRESFRCWEISYEKHKIFWMIHPANNFWHIELRSVKSVLHRFYSGTKCWQTVTFFMVR